MLGLTTGVVAILLTSVVIVASSLYQLRKVRIEKKRVEEEVQRIIEEIKRREEERERQREVEVLQKEAIEKQTAKIVEYDKQIEMQKNELWKQEQEKILAQESVVASEQRLREANQQVILANEKVSELIANEKEIATGRLETEMELLRILKAKEYQERSRLLEEEMLQDYWTLMETIEPLKQELVEYEEKRASIIDALKRERELEERADYYKIKLSSDAINDIKYISEILEKLHNKRIISEVIFKSYIQESAKEMLQRVIGNRKVSGIYRIADVKTQECYIGQGVDVSARLMQHIRGSLGIHSIADQRIHRAMAEKGLENWTFELLEECDRAELTEREKFYIAHYRSNEYGYNKRLG